MSSRGDTHPPRHAHMMAAYARVTFGMLQPGFRYVLDGCCATVQRVVRTYSGNNVHLDLQVAYACKCNYRTEFDLSWAHDNHEFGFDESNVHAWVPYAEQLRQPLRANAHLYDGELLEQLHRAARLDRKSLTIPLFAVPWDAHPPAYYYAFAAEHGFDVELVSNCLVFRW